MIEMMAQTGALLVGVENDFAKDLIFAKIESAEFGDDLPPGTPIQIEAKAENLRPEGGWIDSEIFSGEKRCAASRFLLMNVGHFLPDQTEPITFHSAFLRYFKIREKIS
jgi:3-hydroxymyristoyl/3-hydroxydecanoyl-(acyl carrier protein) dehydratase